MMKKRYDEFRPAISEREWERISQDARLLRYNRMHRWRKVWFGGGAALLTAAAIVAVVILSHPKKQDAPASTVQPKTGQECVNVAENDAPAPTVVEHEHATPNEVPSPTATPDDFAQTVPSTGEPVLASSSTSNVVTVPSSAVAPKDATPPTVTGTKKTTPTKPTPSVTAPPKPSTSTPVATNENNPAPDESPLTEYKLFVPSAFTPNGDGLNDQFLVTANFEPLSFDITIFTKASEKVFHSRRINIGWDGSKYGAILPQGVYLYVIKYTNPDGKVESQKGQILLLK